MRSSLKMVPILAIGLFVMLVAAPGAAAQAALDQYIPKGNPAGGSHGAGTLNSPISPKAAGTSAAHKLVSDRDAGTEKGGRLPGTDYPSTPFLWILIAVLVAGALIRLGTSLMKRRGIWGTS
jgi:hypothetical protein